MYDEHWLPAPGWKQYEVSSLGRVRRKSGRIRALHKPKRGYMNVVLSEGGVAKTVDVHALICAAFHGKPPTKKHHAAHSDGNKYHNQESNLSWKTCRENAVDKIAHGTQPFGKNVHSAKLKESDIPDIRANAENGATHRDQAKRYGVEPSTIGMIVRGNTWRHV